MAKFKYRERSREQVEKRANQKGGAVYDQIFKGNYPEFRPKAGDHSIRILPPTGELEDHYGVDIFMHQQIGPDNQRYLCLEKHKQGDCVICEEKRKADAEKEEEYAKKLYPRKKVAILLIDRNNEKVGPQIWGMPWKGDRDINKKAEDKKTKELLAIDHPEEGYDVEFTVTGTGLHTEYSAWGVARKSTPLSDDEDTMKEWLEKVDEHPLLEQLNFFDADYIKDVFRGKSKKKDEDEEEEEGTTRSERRRRDEDEEEEEKPKKKPAKEEDEEEEEKPKKRSRIEDEEEELDDDKPKKKRRDEEEEEEEKPKKKRRDDDEEEERPKKRARDDDEEEEEKPKKKKRDDDEEEEEERKPSKLKEQIREGMKGGKKRDDDEEEEEKPKKRARDEEEEEEERPRKKRDEDEEEEEKPKKKRRDDDEEEEEERPKKKRRDDDD
jgi:hypothetical protein